jgi:hypothetical protein
MKKCTAALSTASTVVLMWENYTAVSYRSGKAG